MAVRAGNEWTGDHPDAAGLVVDGAPKGWAAAPGDTFWSQSSALILAGGSTVLVAATAPTNHQWDLVAVEVAPVV
jgi:hypothetical protein